MQQGCEYQVLRYLDWPSLERMMRKVGLHGDRNLRPYRDAQIALRKCAIDQLRPTSYYVLRSQIQQQGKLQERLQSEYQLNLFDLAGMLEYTCNNAIFTLAPPIVETYWEPGEGVNVSAIVDGLHRVSLARELGLKEIGVIEVKNVSERFPLVPLPLHWDDVKIVDVVPQTSAKRRFRFPSLESFPDIADLTVVPINAENYLYFFYRDLEGLGSSGIRQSLK